MLLDQQHRTVCPVGYAVGDTPQAYRRFYSRAPASQVDQVEPSHLRRPDNDRHWIARLGKSVKRVP